MGVFGPSSDCKMDSTMDLAAKNRMKKYTESGR